LAAAAAAEIAQANAQLLAFLRDHLIVGVEFGLLLHRDLCDNILLHCNRIKAAFRSAIDDLIEQIIECARVLDKVGQHKAQKMSIDLGGTTRAIDPCHIKIREQVR
jgi:hypothetical protein